MHLETFGENCTQPYSFFHKSSLADISEDEFAKAVRESPIAGNVDDPEGSLDALMQVENWYSCKNQSQCPLTGFEKKKCLKGMPYIFRVHFI